MEGWIVANFTKGTCIKVWSQWSEEGEGRGKWEEVSTAIDFSVGHNGAWGGGSPVEGRES